MKAGIQGAAGLNSEGIEGFPLSFSLRCPRIPEITKVQKKLERHTGPRTEALFYYRL